MSKAAEVLKMISEAAGFRGVITNDISHAYIPSQIFDTREEAAAQAKKNAASRGKHWSAFVVDLDGKSYDI